MAGNSPFPVYWDIFGIVTTERTSNYVILAQACLTSEKALFYNLPFTNPIVFRQRESWGLVCRFVWLAQKIEAKFLSCWMPQKNSRGILTKSCSFAICIFKAVVSISRGFLTRSGSGRSCNSAILGKWEEMGLLGQGKASWKTLRALSCTIRTALHQGSGHLKLWLALRIWPRLFAGNPGFEDNSGEKMDLRDHF